MKRAVIFIIVILFASRCYAQTLVFHLDEKTITSAEVKNDKESISECDENKQLDYRGKITNIYIYENNSKSTSVGHKIKLNQEYLKFVCKITRDSTTIKRILDELKFKEVFSAALENSLTLKDNDTISVYRDKKLVGNIKILPKSKPKRLDQNEVKKWVKLSVKSNKDSICGTIEIESDRIKLKNYTIKYGNTTITNILKPEFTIERSTTANTICVNCTVEDTVRNDEFQVEISKEIATNNLSLCKILSIVGVVVAIVIIIIASIIFLKRKHKHEQKCEVVLSINQNKPERNFQIETLTDQLNNEKNKYNEFVKKAEEEKQKLENKYKQDINNIKSNHNKEKKKIQDENYTLDKYKNDLQKKLKEKENQLHESDCEIEKLIKDNKATENELISSESRVEKLKVFSKKKSTHYIFEIEDTLSDINSSFNSVYKEMPPGIMKEKLIYPISKGIQGLSKGIYSWYDDFIINVKENETFTGDELIAMDEDRVKELLSKKFVMNIIISDCFSKFVRLHFLSKVSFIRQQLLDSNMNLDLFDELYYQIRIMLTHFNYEIICPDLFQELNDNRKYQWYHSTNLFNIIPLTEKSKVILKNKRPDTIIDVTQIGYSSPWNSRKATVVTLDSLT